MLSKRIKKTLLEEIPNLKKYLVFEKIFNDEEYSPAGKEITPNQIVVHKSNPMFRDKIIENGLKVKAGECYKIYVGYGEKCKPAIFATNSTNKRAWFDSLYDDDIWFIDTTKIPDVKWFKDRHFETRSKHIVTFQDIPKEAITLKYEGTGSNEDILKSWPEDSPNRLQESIRRKLRKDSLINDLSESINDDKKFNEKTFEYILNKYYNYEISIKPNSSFFYFSVQIIFYPKSNNPLKEVDAYYATFSTSPPYRRFDENTSYLGNGMFKRLGQTENLYRWSRNKAMNYVENNTI
jgi:hypothetical protein